MKGISGVNILKNTNHFLQRNVLCKQGIMLSIKSGKAKRHLEGLTFYNLEEIEAHAKNLKKKHDAVQDKRANEEKDSDQTFKTM